MNTLIRAGQQSGPVSSSRIVFISCALLTICSVSLAQTAATDINIGTGVTLNTAKRLGINLGAQGFYDSQQLMRNIMFRNPGFEGEIWQSIIHCKTVTANSCTDDNVYSAWYVNFFANASVEFITGGAAGFRTSVAGNTPANQKVGTGAVLRFFASPPGLTAGDYLVVRMGRTGNPQAGWWTYCSNGATLSTEFTDLSPATPGKQALRINAAGPNQFVTVTSYADSSYVQPFIQLNGGYTLFFRAKATGGANQVTVSLSRLLTGNQTLPFFNQNINLANSWQDYSYHFVANDNGQPGFVALTFQLLSTGMLLDDVSLTQDATSDNPTAYRNEVVSTLRALHPGILRFMDAGASLGSSLDNMLAPTFGRMRAGYSAWGTVSTDISMGLHDYLVLCQAIGAEPWYSFPAGSSTQEMANMMDYLGGSTATVYGAKRAALGQAAPWTTVFPVIHLEFGNEVWNGGFSGAAMLDSASYGQRATQMFAAARSSPSYSSNSFDLILDGWATSPAWNQAVLAASANYDSIDAAPYLFYTFNDSSSIENIFGPMFAQPESLDSVPSGVMYQQAKIAAQAAHPANLAVYETNLSTDSGSASQAAISQAVPSLGAGLAATEHMLLMMRDLGVVNQTMFDIGGYSTYFSGTVAGAGSTTPLWGTVVDMGSSNRMRPTYLAEQLANTAILPTMLTALQSGANPTWNQPLSSNDNVSLNGAHYIQSFAFTDGAQNNLVLFNLHRTASQPVTFSGVNAPLGSSTIRTLTSSAINQTNELSNNVSTTSMSQTLARGATLLLPPYSMTVINSASPGAPIINSVAVTCSASTLATGASTPCTAALSASGAFNSQIIWTVDQGSISSNGLYTAPALLPPGAQATITATSVQDPTKAGTITITLAPSSITGVNVACGSGSLVQGAHTSCAASVQGLGNFSPQVTWTASAGAIDANGNVTAPASGSSLVVQAVSQQDPTKSGSQTITVTPPSGKVTFVTVACGSNTLPFGGTTTCAATVHGIGLVSPLVVWSASGGTVDASGNFTAPASGTSLYVAATSIQDKTQYGIQTISLTTPLPQLTTPAAIVTSTTATISWTTNVPTRSGVNYGLVPGQGGSTTPYVFPPTTTPSFTLTGLSRATTYYFAAFSTTTDNTQTAFLQSSFTTAP
ncbi:MAG TPA: hypothetical protein VGD59_02910 [Acidisarcina sp.]